MGHAVGRIGRHRNDIRARDLVDQIHVARQQRAQPRSRIGNVTDMHDGPIRLGSPVMLIACQCQAAAALQHPVARDRE